MQVQMISYVMPAQPRYSKNTNKVQAQKNISFKQFEQVLDKVVSTELTSGKHAVQLFSDLYKALINTPNITKMPDLTTFTQCNLSVWNVASFINALSKPIKEVPGFLRDIVFKSEDENISLIKMGSEDALCMYNLGKFGFFNCLFNSQDAKSDIRFAFQNKNNRFEIGSTKKGLLKVRQECYRDWCEYILYNDSVKSSKSGEYDDTPLIWPF